MTDRIKIQTTERLWDTCSSVSAYEVAEDLQIVAEKLGQKDRGWADLASLLRFANAHVNVTGGFPVEGEPQPVVTLPNSVDFKFLRNEKKNRITG